MLVVAFVVVFLVLLVDRVAAQPAADGGGSSASVTTTIDPCVPVDAAQFQRVLSIELGTSIEYSPDAPTRPGLTWVHVSCTDRGVELRLEDGVTRKSMARVLDASHIEERSRTRLLALAVAEFVVASWVELRVNDKAAIEPVGPPPDRNAAAVAAHTLAAQPSLAVAPALARAPAIDASSVWELFGLFRLEGWSSQLGLVPTFALRAGQRPTEHLAFSLGADFGLTNVGVAQGQVQLALMSASGTLLFVSQVGDFDFYAGGGGRFGFVRVQGLSEDALVRGERFYAPYGGPLTLGRLAYHVTRTFRLVAEGEAGLVTLPVSGLLGKRKVVELDGAWASIGLGLGAVF